MKKIVIFFIFILLINFCSINNENEEGNINTDFDFEVQIDTNNTQGEINHQINCNDGPLSLNGSKNFSSKLKELGVSTIRTHDYYGPCDWHTIFPDWSKDENDPNSYSFSSTDEIISSIKANGFDVLFRIGTSWNSKENEYHNDPPGTIRNENGEITHTADINDFRKFATICKNIIRHYNNGWAYGYNYNIKKIEIWNEPSLYEHFWTGTPQQFYQMFNLVFNELKNYNSNLIIGGPGLAGKSKKEYQEDLLNYFKNNNIDIDFFSWHTYGSKIENDTLIQSPEVVKERIEEINDDLESYGFKNLQTFCTEWNADLQDNNFSTTSRGAAFFAGVLKIFLDNSVTESYFYRGDNSTILGSFDENGELIKCFYT